MKYDIRLLTSARFVLVGDPATYGVELSFNSKSVVSKSADYSSYREDRRGR